MAHTARFGGGPWDGQRNTFAGNDPAAVVDVPPEERGPFMYALRNVEGSWQTGGILAIYDPDPSMDPNT